MGNWNSGRRPQPTAMKVLRGNPGRRPLNTREPVLATAASDFDTPPVEIADNVVAVAEWKRVVPLLRVAGVISNAERAALTALCLEWARWIDAQQKLTATGMLIKGKHDIPVRNPYIQIADHALDKLIKLWAELGLTPSSRSRLIAGRSPDALPASKWAADL